METNNFKTFECFGLVKNKETEKVQIVFGNFLISEKTFNNYESAKKYIRQKPWELIINVSNAIRMFNHESEEQKNKGTKK